MTADQTPKTKNQFTSTPAHTTIIHFDQKAGWQNCASSVSRASQSTSASGEGK